MLAEKNELGEYVFTIVAITCDSSYLKERATRKDKRFEMKYSDLSNFNGEIRYFSLTGEFLYGYCYTNGQKESTISRLNDDASKNYSRRQKKVSETRSVANCWDVTIAYDYYNCTQVYIGGEAVGDPNCEYNSTYYVTETYCTYSDNDNDDDSGGFGNGGGSGTNSKKINIERTDYLKQSCQFCCVPAVMAIINMVENSLSISQAEEFQSKYIEIYQDYYKTDISTDGVSSDKIEQFMKMCGFQISKCWNINSIAECINNGYQVFAFIDAKDDSSYGHALDIVGVNVNNKGNVSSYICINPSTGHKENHNAYEFNKYPTSLYMIRSITNSK